MTQDVFLINCIVQLEEFKVAPYSFLTARELVLKSRDGPSFKKSTRKSHATSTSPRVTRTSRILATIIRFVISNVLAIHRKSFPSFEFYHQTCVLIFTKIAFR